MTQQLSHFYNHMILNYSSSFVVKSILLLVYQESPINHHVLKVQHCLQYGGKKSDAKGRKLISIVAAATNNGFTSLTWPIKNIQ